MLHDSVTQQLAHIQVVQDATNAFSCLASPENLDAQVDAALAADKVQESSPLMGALVSIKDSFHVPGLPRWHGSASHPGDISQTESTPVRRLREAGAIIVGKTTMPDYGLIASGVSSQFGITRNPWDLSASPGGSSSGAGAAVAAGATRYALGTDIAGSVRLPAAHCGISALKPTQGALAYAPASTWRSAGPMAPTIAEVRELFGVVAHPDPADQLSRELPGGSRSGTSQSADAAGAHPRGSFYGLRVGVLEWPGYGPRMDSTTASLFRSTVDLLAADGAELTPLTPGITEADFRALDRCLMARCLAELAGCTAERRDALLPAVRDWAGPGAQLTAAEYVRDFEHLSSVASRLNSEFSHFDLIISPVMGEHSFPATDFGPDTTAPLLFHTNYTAWFNQTGQPAVALPMGLSAAGHPVGVQLAGRLGADIGLLDHAQHLEALLDLRLSYPDLRG